MYTLLPDSKGSVASILFHQTFSYRAQELTSKGIILDLLKKFSVLGNKPTICVISTHTNEEEREFLAHEVESWRPYVGQLLRNEVTVPIEYMNNLPYAQDVGVTTSAPKPSMILSKSKRVYEIPSFSIKLRSLLESSGINVVDLNVDYNLEGGYLYNTSKFSLYSNKKDLNAMGYFNQKSVYVEDILSNFLYELTNILQPGIVYQSLPTHVDLLFSILEKDTELHIFYLDFSDSMYLEPFYFGDKEILIERRIKSYQESVQRIIKMIKKDIKLEVYVHKMPGRIGSEKINYHGRWVTAFYIYSGVNLLHHPIKNKNYAFYLKLPAETDINDMNGMIKTTLSNAGIIPVSIQGSEERNNWFEIRNSAGVRCIAKVLERSDIS